MAISPWTCFEQLTDDSLAVLNGGSVTVYLANTTTLVDLFTADDLTGAAANPIVLDSAGRHAMRYFAAAKYKTLVKNASGSTITTRDNIDPAVPLGSGTLAVANGGTGAATAGAARTNLGAASTAELASLAADVAAGATAVDRTHIATGTTAERAVAPAVGDVRWNTTLKGREWYTGALWWFFGRGTTAERPGSPSAGDRRYNTTLNCEEFYNGTAWIILGKDPTVQRLITGGPLTYTAPAGVVRQRVRMSAGGGGGAARATNNGVTGGTTSLQVNGTGTAWTCIGGSGGIVNSNGGTGGTGGTDGSTGTKICRFDGGDGGAGTSSSVANITPPGGAGGSNPFGGGGARGATGTGASGKTNTGAGGQGAGSASTTISAPGGAAGEYVEFWVTGMATATYTVGAAGTGGAAGTVAGGDGAAGIIIIEEFYS